MIYFTSMKEFVVAKRQFRDTLASRNPGHPHLGLIDADIEHSQRVVDLLDGQALALPEGAIRLPDLTIGGKTVKELEMALKSARHNVSDYAKDLLRNPSFTTLPEPQTISLVRSTVSAMGLSGNPTTDRIYERADELGWDLCPAEVGPHYRLAYTDQPLNEWLAIGMKQIPDSDGNPSVFRLGRRDDGSWLHSGWAYPRDQWGPEAEFVFSLRPSTQAELGAGQASSVA